MLDVVSKESGFNQAGQNVYMWQLNTENNGGPEDYIGCLNAGTNLVLFGLKTENWGTHVKTTNSGNTEILGAWIYANGKSDKTRPVYEVIDGNLSVAASHTLSYSGYPYKDYVWETRNGEKRTFKAPDVSGKFTLFSGHDGVFTSLNTDHLSTGNLLEIYPNPSAGQFILEFREVHSSNVQIRIFYITGNEVYRKKQLLQNSGHKEVLDLSGLPSGCYFLKIETSNQPAFTRKLIKY